MLTLQAPSCPTLKENLHFNKMPEWLTCLLNLERDQLALVCFPLLCLPSSPPNPHAYPGDRWGTGSAGRSDGNGSDVQLEEKARVPSWLLLLP